MRKKRVLFLGEAPFVVSGFGKYAKEVLDRLEATGKYELALLASYGKVRDPRDTGIKYWYYANHVTDQKHPEFKAYKSNPVAQFGEWRLERTMLDFKPDIVACYRDYWMDSFVRRSPYRKYFHWVWMPTVDSAPQQEEWIDTFISADGIMTYTDWAQGVLRQEGNGAITLCGTAAPGVDLKVYSPVRDKAAHKERMGLDPSMNIIGTVMRNQKRKLFPDLFEAFSLFLKRAKADVAAKTFLYCHTSYPDNGWDIPRLLKEHQIGHKVLFTYVCSQCRKPHVAFFKGAIAACPHCKNLTALLPNVSFGVDAEYLAALMNCFDVYVQYAICLGKDEEVRTLGGWTPIKDINQGDMVLTHTGTYHPVTMTMASPNKGSVKEISLCGDYETLTITDNHPVYCYTKETLGSTQDKTAREIFGDKLRKGQVIPTPEWKPVADLSPGDLIAMPIDSEIVELKDLDISEYAKKSDCTITEDEIAYTYGNTYPRYVKLTDDFCYFVGLYAADGHANKSCGQIQVTQASKELDNLHLCTRVAREICPNNLLTISPYDGRDAVDIKIPSTLYRDVFKSWCKSHGEKQLPYWAITQIGLAKQARVLQGLFSGDGCYSNHRGRNVTSFSTISKVLADQVKVLLRRQRCNFNCCIIHKSGNRQPQYTFEIPGDVVKDGFTPTKRTSSAHLYYGDYHLLKIKGISDSDYKDDVYNIEVADDNSYVTKLGCVHNCEGMGMPAIEAAACGVPIMAVDYSAMEDVAKYTGGVALKVKHLFREMESHAYRASPDNEYLADKLVDFFNKPTQMRNRVGRTARKAAEKHWDWDKTAKKWERYFDAVDMSDLQGQWDNPQVDIKPIAPFEAAPQTQDNVAFMKWATLDVLGDPTYLNSQLYLTLLRDLNIKGIVKGGKLHPFERKDAYNIFSNMAKNRNRLEEIRSGRVQMASPDFIEYAHLKKGLVNE